MRRNRLALLVAGVVVATLIVTNGMRASEQRRLAECIYIAQLSSLAYDSDTLTQCNRARSEDFPGARDAVIGGIAKLELAQGNETVDRALYAAKSGHYEAVQLLYSLTGTYLDLPTVPMTYQNERQRRTMRLLRQSSTILLDCIGDEDIASLPLDELLDRIQAHDATESAAETVRQLIEE